MEYELSPDEYAKEQKRLARKYEEQKEKELKKVQYPKFTLFRLLFGKIHNLDDKLFGDKIYDDTFGSYMLTTCFEMGSIFEILCILGFPICCAVFSATTIMGRIGMAILGFIMGNLSAPIIGLVVGYVYGGVFGILLYPLSYPLYAKVLVPFKKKKATKKAKPFLEKIAEYWRNTENKIKKYGEDFDEEAQKLSAKFANTPLTTTIAEVIADQFLSQIKRNSRASHIEKISTFFRFRITEYNIYFSYNNYKFKEHRLENLPNILAQNALAKAVVSKVRSIISSKYDKDASGTDYTLNSTYTTETHYDGDVVLEVNIYYTAPNGNYKPKQQW